ncbi:MAG: polysaccharide biosynthesis tyrosine autokinase [Puniceicoccales bacterium]|jgi:capsular exopolysaccharide synthesis family protein|nr:polysaccharide biosynthesis tyrosine autokinase [Puniceicoccales bacterium]
MPDYPTQNTPPHDAPPPSPPPPQQGGYAGYGYGYGYGPGYGYYGGYPQYGGYYGGYSGYGYGGYGYGGARPDANADAGGGRILTIQDYLLMLRERVWYLILAVIICTACALVYVSNSTNVYQAAAKLRVLRRPYVMPVAGAGQEADPVSSPDDLMTQVEAMRSQAITERVLRRLTVAMKTRVLEPYRNSGGVLSGPLRAVDILDQCRSIVPRPSTLIVLVAYTHPDRDVAREMARLYSEEIVEANLDARTKIMNPMLEKVRFKIEENANALNALYAERQRRLKENPDLYKLSDMLGFGNAELASLNTQLLNIQVGFETATTHWKEMHALKDKGEPTTKLASVAGAPRVAAMESQLAGRRIELAGLLTRYNEDHPAVIAERQKMARAQLEYDEAVREKEIEIDKNYELAKADLEKARSRRDAKVAELTALNEKQSSIRDLNQRIAEKEGAKVRYEMIYQNEQIKAAGGMLPNIEILDPAELTTTRPINKDYIKSGMLGFGAGVAIGLVIVFGLAFLDDRVKSAADIEGYLGLPLIGILPVARRSSSFVKARLVETDRDRPVKEAFRTIYSALRLNDTARNARAILITSTAPSEGKSFVATNLALTFASHGERVLIVDADLRMPVVGKTLRLEGENGITQYFLGKVPLEDAIHYGVANNFDVLPVGAACTNPTQIISSHKFVEMLSTLKTCYDRVIIDSPPIGAVSDALNMLSLVDGIIYVVRFNTVKKRFIRSNIFRLRESKIPILGAVLNQIGMRVVRYYTNTGEKSYSRYYSKPGKGSVEVPAERLSRPAEKAA